MLTKLLEIVVITISLCSLVPRFLAFFLYLLYLFMAMRGIFRPPVNWICITRVRCVFCGVFIPLVNPEVFKILA